MIIILKSEHYVEVVTTKTEERISCLNTFTLELSCLNIVAILSLTTKVCHLNDVYFQEISNLVYDKNFRQRYFHNYLIIFIIVIYQRNKS